jgi:hypothetical protein
VAADLAKWWAARGAWRDVIGTALASRLHLLRAEGSTWVISVPSPSWAAELERLEGTLLTRLARCPEIESVEHLRAVLDTAARPGAALTRRQEICHLGETGQAPDGEARERLADLARRLLAARSEENS